MNTHFLKTAIRVWLMEILVSGFNFFVLMNLIYEPRWGVLVAHQIGLSTRIVYIFVFAYFLLRFVKEYDTGDLVHVGILSLVLTLLFEWVGSFVIGRPVEEILIGLNILAGTCGPTYYQPICYQTLLLVHFLHQVKEARVCMQEDRGVRRQNHCSKDGSLRVSWWALAIDPEGNQFATLQSV